MRRGYGRCIPPYRPPPYPDIRPLLPASRKTACANPFRHGKSFVPSRWNETFSVAEQNLPHGGTD
ncbi:hypothetical protein [Bacteroides gallinarum]|uniref:hypothetical protein n=1 Tax=Bacteroides gallinarum TaxID=376806 RepID=UPI000FE147DC|nr:hypothetical protein [Bacteroides gallinarum]